MIYELRTYTLKPGTAMAYVELFSQLGVAIVTRHLPMVGYWHSEVGELNQLWHLWAYESMGDRAACRASLSADKRWLDEFIEPAFVNVVAQRNAFYAPLLVGDAVAAAVTERQRAKEALAAGTQLLANEWHGFVHNAAETHSTDLATFSCIAGRPFGERLALRRLEPACRLDTLASPGETLTLARPLSCSQIV